MESLLQEIVALGATVRDYLAFDAARLTQGDLSWRVLLQVLLLIGSAFFSGSETALFSLSRLDLQMLRKERHRFSEVLHELLDQPRRLIISILCGNELVNIAAAANMAGILVSLYGLDKGAVISIAFMVPLLLLFGEMTPKTIAVANPLRISAGLVAAPMSVWVRAVGPLRWAVRAVADSITTLIVGEEKAAENILNVDEFRSLVEEVAKEGELNATERALIYNLLEAGDTEVVEIMTPRTRTAFIDASHTVPEMVEQFRKLRHPRVPVFHHRQDNLVGFLHAEDMLRLLHGEQNLADLDPADVMQPPVVVPLTKKVDEMFDFFQSRNARAAAVLDEFGGVEGFVTMKDVLGFIFGNVSGKVRGQELYQEVDENDYVVPGDMKLTDFNNLTNFGIEDPRMTTIGGVVFRLLDHLPKLGDQTDLEGVVMTVLEMDAHRIARVRVNRGPLPEITEFDQVVPVDPTAVALQTEPEPEVGSESEAETDPVAEEPAELLAVAGKARVED